MAVVLRDVVATLLLVAVVVNGLQVAEEFIICAHQLSLCNTEFVSAFDFCHNSLDSFSILTGLRNDVNGQCVTRLGEQISAVVHSCLNKWAVGLLCHFAETLVQSRSGQCGEIVLHQEIL